VLGLPAGTEIRKPIPKKKVYELFASEMGAARRRSFDGDVARITLTNEVSPASLNLAEGREVHSFFVAAVALRKKNFDKQNIALIGRMFGQNLVLVLSHEQEERLALWQTKLIMDDWKPLGTKRLDLQGLDMDAVWEGVVAQVGGIRIEEGKTLDEQIALDDARGKLQREIDRLEKRARAEKQPKKKMGYVQRMLALRSALSEMSFSNKERI
jgi:hypothetical protein